MRQWEDIASFSAGNKETPQIPARHGGPMRNPQVPEIYGAPPQKAAIPEVGAGTCSRHGQVTNSFPEWDHHGPARGLRGLFGGPPQGLQPLCCPCEEGHNHAKRHSVGTPHQRGEELRALTGLTKTLSFSGPPHPPKGVYL